MAIALVNAMTGTISASTSGSITIPATTIGNLVIVNVKFSSSTAQTLTVTDNVGNTYSSTALTVATTIRMYQLYGVQTIGGATSLTLSWTTSGTIRANIEEFSGALQSQASVFDKGSTGTAGTGTASSVTSFSPSATGELVVGCIGTINAITSPAGGSGYTLAPDNTTNMFTVYRTNSTTTETAPATWTSSVGWVEIAGAYLPFTSTPPTITYITYSPPFLS